MRLRGVLAALILAHVWEVAAFEADPAVLLASGWGRDRGLIVRNLNFTRVSEAEGRVGLRGLVTTKAVKKGETLIRVPKKLALHVGSMKGAYRDVGLGFLWDQCDPSKMAENENEVVLQQHLLAFLLIAHTRNPKSYYAPWLATFPREVHTPYTYSPEELVELRTTDPMLWEEAMHLRRIMRWNFDYLSDILNNPRNPRVFEPAVTEVEFAQAYTWAMTRDFSVHGENDERAAIIPFADYVNHKNGKETVALLENADSSLEIQAIVDLSANTEITLMYGSLSSSGLVAYWGFVMDNNVEDEVNVDVIIPDLAPFANEKRRLIAQHQDKLQVKIKDGKDVDMLLRLMRMLASSEMEFCECFGLPLRTFQDFRMTFDEVGERGYLMGVMKGTPAEEQDALGYAVSVIENQIIRLSAADDNTPLVAKDAPMTDNLMLILKYRKSLRRQLEQLRNVMEGLDTLDSVGLEIKNIHMQMDEQIVEEMIRDKMKEEGEVIEN